MKEYTYNELKIGHIEEFSRRISDKDIISFSKLSGDRNPLHLDESYARTTEFGKCVAFGMLAGIMHSTLAGMYLPGKYSLILKEESSFIGPVFSGDNIKITGELKDKKDFGKLLFIETKILNQKQKTIIKGKLIVKCLK